MPKTKKSVKKKLIKKKTKKRVKVSRTDVIFDSTVGKTDALFVSDPEIEQALNEFDNLQENKNENNNSNNINNFNNMDNQKSVEQNSPPPKASAVGTTKSAYGQTKSAERGKVLWWRKIFSLNNRLFSLLIGLVFAGVFCAGAYTFAAYVQLGQLDPLCAPGATGCTVPPPLTDSFTSDFTGTGDLTTTGSLHVGNVNNTSYQYFGSDDQASIRYNGSNLVLNPGTLASTMTIGTGADLNYQLQFDALNRDGNFTWHSDTNPGFFSVNTTAGAYANISAGIISAIGLKLIDAEDTIIYTMPTDNGDSGQVLTTNGSGTITWATPASGLPTQTGNNGKYLTTDGSSASWATVTAGMTNPMSAAGDLIYGGTSGAATRLAANSDATNKFLRSVSNGNPSWQSIAQADISGLTTASSPSFTALTATGANGLILGTDVAGGTTNIPGYIKMFSNGDNAYYSTFTAGTQSGNLAYTLPTAFGTGGSNYVLTDAAGNGTLSWAAAASSGVPYTGANANVDLGSYTLTTTGAGTFGSVVAKYDTSNYATITPGATGTVTIATTSGATGDIIFDADGSAGDPEILSDSGKIIMGSNGATNKENLIWDFETTPNTVVVSSSTGVNNIALSGIILDPPAVMLEAITKADFISKFSNNAMLQSKAGVSLIFDKDTQKIEYYMASEDKFYDLSANLISSVDLNSSGTSGNGSVLGVNNATFGARVASGLTALGITIEKGAMSLTSITAKTARMNKIEMVAENGDVYCTWVDNSGNWQKAKGECASADVATAVSTSPDSTSQIVEQTTQVVENAQQILQESQHTIAQGNELIQQGQEVLNAVNEQITGLQTTNIASLAVIADINVAYGTDLASANLPTTVSATLADATTQELAITWDSGTPAYDGNVAGTYAFSGTLTVPGSVTNSSNLKAVVNVIVAPQPAPVAETEQPVVSENQSPSDVVQQAAAGFLNGVWNFISWLIGAPIKKLSSLQIIQNIAMGLNQNSETLKAGLSEPFKNLFIK